MPHISSFTFLDYSNEKSNVRIYNDAITAVSIAGFLTSFGALRTALENITRGVIMKEAWIGDETLLTSTPPTDPLAQREGKWLVRYTNAATGKIFTLEIPTAELVANRLLPQSDFADLVNDTAMAAFVTAFEAHASPPDDPAAAVSVQSVQYVGRNI